MTKYTEPRNESYPDFLTRLYPEEFKNLNSVLTLTFQVTEDCCMACTYCYQHNKSHNRMDFTTAKQIIDNLFNSDECYNTQEVNSLIIEFIGGEPFLEIDLINQICDYYFQEAIKLSHRFLKHTRISISSNGLLYFQEKVQKFIKKYRNYLSMTISIDGNKELHDACRFDLEGRGTYYRAIAAAMDLRKLQGKNIETKMTLSPDNIGYTFEAVKNLISLDYQIIHLNCVYEEGWTLQHATALYQQLKQLADWLFENDAFKKYYISMFDERFFKPLMPEENNNWCGGVCNGMLAFDYKGSAYPCIRYMGSSLNGKQIPYSIGTVDGLFLTPEEKERRDVLTAITRRSQSTNECFNCRIATGCGWCSGYNYECAGTPDWRATYICWMHKARSLANAYYYNKGYSLLGEDTRLEIYLPEADALQIISEQEWKELNSL